ncbi:MAG: signal peptidase I [Candidatus Marinimicrobia bacterium]|nr:signal peptidase I [Candidatus Neomarinimicrobiota bacterium]MCF7828190.1 signal peptidase I [Candidatus Neomarinimicrobiota bacterium]MCF7879635.1 signal peptidase I [Candidatus Neomarinimicrobiota bacterium]
MNEKKNSEHQKSVSTPPQPSRKERIIREVKSIALIIIIALFVRSTIIEAYQVPTGSMENTILVGDFILGNKFIYGVRTPDWFGIPFTKVGFHVPNWRTPPLDAPEQGDVVIFQYPLDDRVNYIKRLVALPGQTLEVRDKVLYVDGEKFDNAEGTKFTTNHVRPDQWQEPNIFPPGYGNKDNYGPLTIPKEGMTYNFGQDNTALIRYLIEQDGHEFAHSGGRYYVDDEPANSYTVEQDYYFMMGDNRDNSWDSRYWGPVPADNILGEGMITYFSWNKNVPLYRLGDKIRWGRIGDLVN